jgi:hypothetical protein
MLKIIFDHVRKTGGTSVFELLRDTFGAENVSPKLACKLSHAASLYKRKQVIIGHFGISPDDKLPVDRMSLTFVRDPRERTLSEFYYTKYSVPQSHLSHDELRMTELDIDQAVRDAEICGRLGNYQSLHYASFFHPKPHLLSEHQLLELAKRGLDQFDLVGTTESIPEFIGELERILSAEQLNRLTHANQTNRIAFAELSRDTQLRIEEINRVDLQLWHYARNLFAEKTKHFSLPAPNASLTRNSQESKGIIVDQTISLSREEGHLELLSAFAFSRFRSGSNFLAGEDAALVIEFRCHKSVDDLTIGYSLHHDSGLILFGVNTRLMGYKMSCDAGSDFQISFTFPILLGIGTYTVDVSAHTGLEHIGCCYFYRKRAATFEVESFAGIQFEGLIQLMPTAHFGDGIRCEDTLNHSFGFRRIGFAPLGTIGGEIRAFASIPSVRVREQFSVPIEITNAGTEAWHCEGTQQVNISYHWYDKNGKVVQFDGVRSALPTRVIKPGITARGSALVEAPKAPGRFTLELTLVQEQVCWFEDRGFLTAKCEVDVKAI